MKRKASGRLTGFRPRNGAHASIQRPSGAIPGQHQDRLPQRLAESRPIRPYPVHKRGGPLRAAEEDLAVGTKHALRPSTPGICPGRRSPVQRREPEARLPLAIRGLHTTCRLSVEMS